MFFLFFPKILEKIVIAQTAFYKFCLDKKIAIH